MDHVLRSKRPWYLGILLLFMVPLPGIGIDLYAPSLPWLVSGLHANMHLVKLTIAIYLAGYGVGPLIFGTLSDTHGRKKILVIGLILNILTLCVILLWQNIYVLLTMRFFQGFSIGAIGAMSKAMVTDTYEPGLEIRKMGAAMSMTWAIGPVIAPFIGGYLQHYFGWQANFMFFIGYAVIVLITAMLLPETNLHRSRLSWSVINNNYRTIIKSKPFWDGIICMGVAYSMIVLFNVIGPFFIQTVLHYSPIQFGHIALVMGFAFFSGGFINRGLVHKFSSAVLVQTSLATIIVLCISMIAIGMFTSVNLYRFTIPIFLILFFSSAVFPAGMSKVMSLFPSMAGSASALMGFLFIIIASSATAIASFLDSSNQVPLGIAYLILALLCFLSYKLFAAE